MRIYLSLIAFSAFFYSCTNNQQKTPESRNAAMETTVSEEKKYTPEMVVNKTDFICGMPTTAGISDTCHIEGKAYGFCSSECTAEFKKDPAKYLASK